MRRLSGFIVGLALGLTAPTAADEIAIRCQPTVKEQLPECGNDLATYFKQGRVPNRCKIS